MMKFSLILASRERTQLLSSLLTSIRKTTVNLQEIEVLVVIDEDDGMTRQAVSHFTSAYLPLDVKFFVRPRSEWMHRDYINWVYPETKGKYVIVLNDDTKFVQNGWDELSFETLEKYLEDKPDGVVYGFTENFTNDPKLCCFPLFSRKAIDAVGFVLPNERKTWAADHDAYKIYTHQLVGRKLSLPDLKIEHVSYHTSSRERDSVNDRVEKIFTEAPYFDVPVTVYADRIARYIENYAMIIPDRRILVVYNICGISGKENDSYYLYAINSVLNQQFPGFRLVVSGCLSSDSTKKAITDAFGSRLIYNWIEERLPLNVTFNHTVMRCVKEYGPFEAYLYLDCGVNLNKSLDAISDLFALLKSGDYAMATAQVDSDTGFEYWGVKIEDKDYVMPIGKACNLHCQIFSHELYEKYNGRIMPDIFANDSSESVYTFLNAAIDKKWIVSSKLKVHHECMVDGPSCGFPRDGELLFRPKKNIDDICREGRQFGFGYEEYRGICIHQREKFDDNGNALDPGLYKFLKENLYHKKETFNYDTVSHLFFGDNRGISSKEIKSPHMTCIIVSHNKPRYVKETIRSVIRQEYQDWEAIVIDSGILYDQGFFDYLKEDSRFKVVTTGETEELKKKTAMHSWCFNECYRRKLVNGYLVTYLHDDDIFYSNAFGVFVEFVKNNPQAYAMYASEDMVVCVDGKTISIGDRRATSKRGNCIRSDKLECLDCLQFCHRKDVMDWMPNQNRYFPEDSRFATLSEGMFMDTVGGIVPVYPIDIKICQSRRTPESVFNPS